VTENAISETVDLATFDSILIDEMIEFMDQVAPPWND
jgi:hypothetical protein